jgi:PIN domain nuclease of toxin-antitoxin system
VIVLDTHVLVWFAEDNPRLGARATKLTDAALNRNEVAVSAISFWEIAMLAAKGRLALEVSPAAFHRRVLEQGVREVGVSGTIAIAAAHLEKFHADPADRIVVATAISLGARLLTADDPVLRWRGSLRTHDARR